MLHLFTCHGGIMPRLAELLLSTGINLLKKIYHNFSSILHVITGFLQHFEIKYFF